MEKIVAHGLLYDFYGELLTDHQRQIYEDAVYNDMSLAEIASIHEISRQGVHDILKRSDKILEGYESRLHLVEKFGMIKEKIREINQLTADMGRKSAGQIPQELHRISQLSNEIIEEL